jgi:hypothetical protein
VGNLNILCWVSSFLFSGIEHSLSIIQDGHLTLYFASICSVLGPAEAVVWCLLGILWEAGSRLLQGIALASNLRCQAWLHIRKPRRAKLSALKSFLFLLLMSLLLTILIIMTARSNLLHGLTKDSTLQALLKDLLPLLGIGVVVEGFRSTSWMLLISQPGQRATASFVIWLVSWCVTMPMAATLSLHFAMDLQGQTTAIILGSLFTSMIHAYLFFAYEELPVNKVAKQTTAGPTPDTAVLIMDEKPVPRNDTSSSSSSRSYYGDNKNGDEGDVSTWSSQDDDDDNDGGNEVISSSSSSSEELSSYLSSDELVSGSTTTSSQLERSYTMESGSLLISKKKPKSRASPRGNARKGSKTPPTPQLALGKHLEKSTTSSSKALLRTRSPLADGLSTESSSSAAGKAILEYRNTGDLGQLSARELRQMQTELNRILNGLKASLRYDLDRSKKRVLAELQWVLYVSPDIFEVGHLERVIGFLQEDEDCRQELWGPIQQYLAEPLRRMGLNKLLANDYLVAHNLKARMDKFVSDATEDDNSLEEDEDEMMGIEHNDLRVIQCAFPRLVDYPFCFVLQE